MKAQQRFHLILTLFQTSYFLALATFFMAYCYAVPPPQPAISALLSKISRSLSLARSFPATRGGTA